MCTLIIEQLLKHSNSAVITHKSFIVEFPSAALSQRYARNKMCFVLCIRDKILNYMSPDSYMSTDSWLSLTTVAIDQFAYIQGKLTGIFIANILAH